MNISAPCTAALPTNLRRAATVLSLTALLALAACSDNDTENNENDSRTAVRVTNTSIVEPSIADTRATDAAWTPGDAIGLMLLNPGTDTPVDSRTAYRYVTSDATGSFSPADAQNTAYYPTQDAPTDVIAFYPYQEVEADLMLPVSTASQASLAAIDLMASNRSTGHSASNPDVALTFSHRLTKLVVSVDRELSAANVDLAGATLSIEGTATRAQWNLSTATLTVDDASIAPILLPTTHNAATGSLSGTAIVVPTQAGAGVKFVIRTADGRKTFEAALATTHALAAGTVNTLRIHLKQTEAAISVTVSPWTEGVSADLTNLTIDVSATHGTAEGINSLTLWIADAPDEVARYTFDPATARWSTPTPFYLEALTGTEEFYARVAPSDATATDGLPDLLGNTLPALANLSTGGLAIDLQHLMSRIDLRLTKGTDFPDNISLAAATVTLNGLLTGYEVSSTNIVTALAATEPDVYAPVTDALGAATVIIAPQTVSAGSKFTVILSTGNSYTATLATDLILEPGKKHTLALSIVPSGLAIAISVSPWETGDGYQDAIRIDGILTTGTGSITGNESLAPIEADLLTLTHLGAANDANATTLPTALYRYTAGQWTTDAPLYWDHLSQAAASRHRFHLLYTPATTPLGENETDFLAAEALVDFGSALNFNLTHALAFVEVHLVAGTGFSTTDLKDATVTLPAVQPLAAISALGIDLGTTPQTRTLNTTAAGSAVHSLIIAPQTLAPGSTAVTVKLKGIEGTYSLKAPASGIVAQAGKISVVKVTLNKTEAGHLSVTLTDWTPGNEYNGNADYED